MHVLIAFAISITFVQTFWQIILVAFGALLPDIDSRTSILGRFNPFTRWMKHRGKCHTIVGVLLLTSPFFLLNSLYGAFIFVGAMIHIVSDKIYSCFPRRQKFSIRLW